MEQYISEFNEDGYLIFNLKKAWKNEYVQTAIVIGIIAVVVFGFWFGSQVILNTSYPALAVVSGSMCVPYNGRCDGWSHPFSQTLHIGDLIIVQGSDPLDLNSDYPNSDIIVFNNPNDLSELIVHRIVSREVNDGKAYFYTKGDGNSNIKWPETPSSLDPWNPVSEDLLVGKVIMRIPWIGHFVLFMREGIGLPIVIGLIILLIIAEFLIPIIKKKKKQIRVNNTQLDQNSS
jgi:signal peptidase I